VPVVANLPELAVVSRQPIVAGPVPAPGLLAARTSIPASPAGLVPRRAVHARLDRGVAHGLTVLSAGPGWGKTSAVADWAAKADENGGVAWLSLAPSDDTLASFWTAVLYALHASGQVPADHRLAALSPVDAMSTAMLQPTYEALLTVASPSVLVLDDFHVIQDAAVLESIGPLLSRDMPLSVILLSRRDPVLPLHRLRLTGELTEIVADDLAFRRDELAAVMAAAGLNVGDDDLDRIRERTEGWPAGVRLAILHLSKHGSATDLSDFGGTDRSVAEYLVAEVLDRQTPELRPFLLQTSVASMICADLADAIAPGGRSRHHLEHLEHTNQFVNALGRDRQWFRYHPLLREMLEHVLARDQPAQFRAAHARAASWLARHHEPVAALRHAASAGDWTLFSTIFVQSAAPAILGPDRKIIAELLASVPFDELAPTTPLALCAWALSFLQEAPPSTSEHLAAARTLLPATPEAIRPAAAALVEMVACVVARTTGDAAGTRTTANAALAQLEQVSPPFPALRSLRAIATNNLAVGMLWSGQTQAARPVFRAAATEALATQHYLPAINALAHLSLCELVEGRLDEADEAARAALDLAEPRGVTSRFQVRCAYISQAFLDVLRGDAAAADRHGAAALAAVEGANEPAPALAVCICQALTAVARRRLRAAADALNAAGIAAKGWDRPAFLDDWLTRAATEVRLLDHRPAETAATVERLRASARPTATVQVCLSRLLLAGGDAPGAASTARAVCESINSPDHVDTIALVEALLVRALAADQLRHDHDALQYLSRALDAAEPQRLLRPFLVTGSERLPGLIRRCVEYTEPRAIARDVLAILGEPAPPIREPEPLQEPLTERELTVLTALPAMHTNAEIAQRLFVSVNTVKAHLKGLYRKLDVNTRRDAIHRAQQLGLVP
jgi:LuxR family maltose regulon positive regulatory protein